MSALPEPSLLALRDRLEVAEARLEKAVADGESADVCVALAEQKHRVQELLVTRLNRLTDRAREAREAARRDDSRHDVEPVDVTFDFLSDGHVFPIRGLES